MNAILLTDGTDLQAGAVRRASGGDNPVPEAKVEREVRQLPGANYRKWETAGSGVETALFVSVQAVMLLCVVLVAAQLFATV